MTKTYSVEAKIDENMHIISDEIVQYFPKSEHMRIALLFEEAFVNIANYAYQSDTPVKKRYIKIIFKQNDSGSYLIFKDRGQAFDPSAYHPSVPNEKQIGGHGIRMMQQLSKDLRYKRIFGENKLTIQVE